MVHIRHATEADLPAILGIHNYYVLWSTATPSRDPRTADEHYKWFTAQVAAEYPILIAEQSDCLVGYCYLDRLASSVSFAPSLEEHIYLYPRQVGRGIGTQLLRAIVERARDLSIRTLIARIDVRNHASLRLHEKCGFVSAGTVRDIAYKNGTFISFTIMQYLFEGDFKFN